MKNAPFVIKLMYKHGLDPLMMAIEIGKPEIAVELFKAGARKTNAVVIAAKKKGYTTFVKYVKDNFKVICDPLGYSQHTGQCWADSFQELFFFADGLKEFTQWRSRIDIMLVSKQYETDLYIIIIIL